MDEKHPIKFSLGQFVILLGIQVVVLALVFLLGARFGGSLFPNFYAKQFNLPSQFQGLQPGQGQNTPNRQPKSDKLVDTLYDEEEAEAGDNQIPHFQVGADGVTRPAEDENTEVEEGVEEESLTVNKSLFNHPMEKQTMVRFKSSGTNKFAIEVGDYFDELLASRKINTLKNKGYEAYLVIKDSSGRSPTFSVRVGLFGDRQIAEEFATQMSNQQGLELRVVKVN